MSAAPLKTEAIRAPTAISKLPQAGSNKTRSPNFTWQFVKVIKQQFAIAPQNVFDAAADDHAAGELHRGVFAGRDSQRGQLFVAERFR